LAELPIIYQCREIRAGRIASTFEIAADYELSAQNLKPLGRSNEEQIIAEAMAKHRTNPSALVHELLENFNVEGYLLQAGITTAQTSRIRDRLIKS
jgi:hypothetical protein